MEDIFGSNENLEELQEDILKTEKQCFKNQVKDDAGKQGSEARIKSRVEFLKAKITRYIGEINCLIKTLFLHNNKGLKKSYFNIHKVKKTKEKIDETPNSVNNICETFHPKDTNDKDSFEAYFNYGYTSFDDKSEIESDNRESLFMQCFNTKSPQFISIDETANHDDVDDNQFFENLNVMPCSSKSPAVETVAKPKNERFFNDEELGKISDAFEHLKFLNFSDAAKFNQDFCRKRYNMLSPKEKQKFIDLVIVS